MYMMLSVGLLMLGFLPSLIKIGNGIELGFPIVSTFLVIGGIFFMFKAGENPDE